MDKEMLAALADEVRHHMAKQVAPLTERIVELEERLAVAESRAPEKGEKGEPGEPGKSLSLDDVRDYIEGLHAKHALGLERRTTDYLERLEVRDGKDGIDGKDGRDGADGLPGADGRDGKDADPAVAAKIALDMLRKEVPDLIQKATAEEVAKIPLPQDGRDGRDGVDGKDGAAGRDGIDGKDGLPGVDGKDGADATPEMVDAAVSKRIEAFTARLELDMERKNIEWRDRLADEVRRTVDAWPRPKDGRDGAGIADIEMQQISDRTWALKQRTENGETVVRELTFPVPIYRDIWKRDTQYQQHDLVTHDGSTWIAQTDNKGVRPGHVSKAWKLIVKKGRDGKDG